MANKTIESYTGATGIDPVNDLMLIYNNTAGAYESINRNTIMGVSGTPADLSSIQTFTNKTLTSPTISGPTLSGTITGTYTIGGTPTFPSSVVTLSGTQTLTNKTLTSPVITGGSISNSTIAVDTIVGYTTSTISTIGGVTFNNGVATTSGFVSTTGLATNAVQANQMATNAITLGYAQITSNVSIPSTPLTQVTGLTVTVTIPAGGRKVKISTYCPDFSNAAVSQSAIQIWDGAVGAGTQLQGADWVHSIAMSLWPSYQVAIVTPSAGSKTYNVGAKTSSGTATYNASSTQPGFILVELI